MRLLSIRNEFCCCALERGCAEDLQLLFDAKMLAYTDDNPDVNYNREVVLRGMRENGPDFYSALLNDLNDKHFVLLDEEGKLIGSALTYQTSEPGIMFFGASHIRSDYRGRNLVDLFYGVRENYAQSVEGCETLQLYTRPDNRISQRVAERNRFSYVRPDESGLLVFEKRL